MPGTDHAMMSTAWVKTVRRRNITGGENDVSESTVFDKRHASRNSNGKQHIRHFSEHPEYCQNYVIDLKDLVNQKIYALMTAIMQPCF